VSYEEEDKCGRDMSGRSVVMRRRIHVCHMRRRINVDAI
jgi:hypothetical protein